MDRQASPVISARTGAAFEAVEAVPVANDNLPPGDGGDELEGRVAVPADPKILHDSDRSSRRRTHQPKTQRHLLTVSGQRPLLLLLPHVEHHLRGVRHVPAPPQLRRQLLPPPLYLRRPRVPAVAGHELVDHAGDGDSAPAGGLLHALLLHHPPHPSLLPPPGAGVDVAEHDVVPVVARLQAAELPHC
ncbi:unnamed protein product [Spirodela intermedia]|uniref:Uncharacterized protein n=1 Tax=Spirodela intermedia TaxID=51605 RepID=A0A7I8JKX7_SPIIN|nr:unnamed protein product [Spirodela intermedia]CAA6670710.1 unnamed protein product [Spirodela intermedia]